jgi:hypothetical protein
MDAPAEKELKAIRWRLYGNEQESVFAVPPSDPTRNGIPLNKTPKTFTIMKELRSILPEIAYYEGEFYMRPGDLVEIQFMVGDKLLLILGTYFCDLVGSDGSRCIKIDQKCYDVKNVFSFKIIERSHNLLTYIDKVVEQVITPEANNVSNTTHR